MLGKLFKDEKIFVFLMFCLAFVFRLLGIVKIGLSGDFLQHWQLVGKMVKSGDLLLLGPSASVNPIIHLPPYYFYLLSIPYLLGKGNYHFAILFFSFINSLAIFPLFYLSKNWFDKKLAYRIVSLYVFSSYLISIQNYPSNAFVVPVLTVICLYILNKTRSKRIEFIPLLSLFLGLGLSFHATFLFIIPLFLTFLPYKKITLNIAIFSVLLFTIPQLTWIEFEIQNNFIQSRQILSVFTPSTQQCNFVNWLSNHGHGERCFNYIRNTLFIFRLFSQTVFANRGLVSTAISFLIVVFALYKTKNLQKKFFIFWIMSVFMFFLTYSQNVYLHFFLILIPLPIFTLTLFLKLVEDQGKTGKVLAEIFFISVVVLNILSYLKSFS